MEYEVVFTEKALKSLKKMDKHISSLIIGWVEKNLQGCANPRQFGKGLIANRSGQWRYRIGDYRLLADIQDEKIIILIINVGHRRDIYE